VSEPVEAALRGLCSTLGGRFEPASWIKPFHRMSLSVAGREAVLRAGVQEAGAHLSVDMRRASPGALKVCQEGVLESIVKLFGSQDLAVGDAPFDALYVVKASPESLARRALVPAVIRLVRDLGACGIMIDLSRERLVVRTSGDVSESSVRGVVELAGKLVDALGGAAEVFWDGTGRCLVCGTALAERRVACADCATPHHRECWEFAGGCSTYACGGTRFV